MSLTRLFCLHSVEWSPPPYLSRLGVDFLLQSKKILFNNHFEGNRKTLNKSREKESTISRKNELGNIDG